MIISAKNHSCNYGPWRAAYNKVIFNRLGMVFNTPVTDYLFILMDAGRDVRIAMIEDKLRACRNLEHENWSIIGRVYELSADWVDQVHPHISYTFREIKITGGNYYLLKNEK